MDYGSVNVFLSRVNPFPSREENAQFTRITSDYGLGQGDWILCPNLHEGSSSFSLFCPFFFFFSLFFFFFHCFSLTKLFFFFLVSRLIFFFCQILGQGHGQLASRLSWTPPITSTSF